MVVVGVGIQLLLARTANRDIGRVLTERADATVDIVARASTRHLRVPQAAIEPGVIVFDGSGTAVAGSVQPDAHESAEHLATTTTTRTASGPEGSGVRLLGQPFATPSGERGVVVVSEETSPYDRSEFYALLATGGLGLLVVGATALIALRVTKQALAPVRQMAERAAEWSEHDLTHRFDLGPPTNELGELGETLDHLLGRVAAAIRSEQRLTSELAHELRTPLTAVKGSAELALLRGVADAETRRDLEQIARSARDMSIVISTLLDVARTGTSSGGAQTCLASDVLAPMLTQGPETVDVADGTRGSQARIAAPPELVARVLQPLVDNALGHARSSVRLVAVDRSDRVVVTVADDGPGVSEELRATLFEPGVSSTSGGAGLGLGIARRVARTIGAEIAVDRPESGASFTVSFPRH
jgi:two-component system OmpR family sensor kinase